MTTQKLSDSKSPYRRIVLKVSGGYLKGEKSNTGAICAKSVVAVVAQVEFARQAGCQVAVVVGGGNIHRGVTGEQKHCIDRSTSDYMGMLATAYNGLAISDALEKREIPTRVQSAIPMNQVAEPFILRRAIRHLEKNRVVIFVAGTGNPYFSTDTAAALRASEIHADVLLKATNVDGVYTCDPKRHTGAQKYETVNYIDALKEKLNVFDSTAFSLCMDNHMPIIVYDINEPTSLPAILKGEKVGTYVGDVETKLAPKKILPIPIPEADPVSAVA